MIVYEKPAEYRGTIEVHPAGLYWLWTCKSRNGNPLGRGKGYKRRAGALNAIDAQYGSRLTDIALRTLKAMAIRYPDEHTDMTAEDVCSEHSHTKDVFDLATALAAVCQGDPPSDEQIAWFLNDAEAIVTDYLAYEGSPFLWRVQLDIDSPRPPGVIDMLKVNNVRYVIQDSDWEPSVPQRRSTYLADRGLTEADLVS